MYIYRSIMFGGRMILYHGSEHRIEKPQFGKGKLHNDYGRGFYCTEHIALANEWAIDHNRNGYCNAYKIDIESLNVLQLNDSMYSILHWITVLLENRTFDILTDFGKEAVAYLKENFSLPYHDADIIIGYRADDSYFSYASDFINNIISLQTLAKAMQLGNLGEQIVVKSELAFSKLQFIGAEKVLSEEWYGAKFERDRQARKKYQEMRNEPWTKGNIYMMALLEQEVKADDERIRL